VIAEEKIAIEHKKNPFEEEEKDRIADEEAKV
jgi:hypothetical protein